MRLLIFARICKAVCILVRLTARPMARRYKSAAAAYYWSDPRCYRYSKKQIYVLPDWFYFLLKYGCNWISDKNVVDMKTMHSARLQAAVEWVIHRIPKKIRFSEILQQTPAPGQQGRALITPKRDKEVLS